MTAEYIRELFVPPMSLMRLMGLNTFASTTSGDVELMFLIESSFILNLCLGKKLEVRR